MAYVWSNSLAIGDPTIDAQHKLLVNMVNELVDSCCRGQGRATLSMTLNFLIEYTVKHFQDEETIQQKYSYPGYASHKKLHDDFKVYVGQLAKQLETEGATVTLVGNVNSSLGSWLVNHIQNEDVKIGEHIRKNCA